MNRISLLLGLLAVSCTPSPAAADQNIQMLGNILGSAIGGKIGHNNYYGPMLGSVVGNMAGSRLDQAIHPQQQPLPQLQQPQYAYPRYAQPIVQPQYQGGITYGPVTWHNGYGPGKEGGK